VGGDLHQLRRRAILIAGQYLESRPVYLDTETTGLEARDEIVEICVLDHDGVTLVDTLVRPQQRIPPGATRIHGITDEMVRGAPNWSEAWPGVLSVLCKRSVGVYNAEFDLRLMHQSHRAAGLSWQPLEAKLFCIMRLYADLRGEPGRDGSPRWHSLDEAGRRCNIPLPNAHRARADALLAREVLHSIARADS
jgi:DNA polymerase-3 subunit epsilon